MARRRQEEHRDLKIAVLTDLHVGSPYMGLSKLRRVVGRTNEEPPDPVLLLGDFVGVGVGTSIVPARFRVPPEIVIPSLEGGG